LTSDSLELRTYAVAMERGQPFIRLKLDVKEPIELGEFVGAFTALAGEFDRYERAASPGTPPDTTLFVRDVRDGCIVAEIVKWGVAGFGVLGGANVLAEFVKNYGSRLGVYKEVGGRATDATKAELKDFSAQVAAIASNPNSSLSVAAIEVENGEEKVRAVFRFDTAEARDIQQRVEEHRREMDHNSRADHERVLMVFTRSDVGNATLGKRSGENVRIEAISNKPRPIIYASEMAAAEIKHEIADAEDNVYKKGFVVDVNVESRNGKPVAYSVKTLHQIIDLPDAEEP
jgi:hypothetical protein